MNLNDLPKNIEIHPLEPFLPTNAKLLFLGSFPPPRKRWCMDFYYPNFGNDHWRIEGEVWFGDRNHFVDLQNKCFRKEEIVAFMHEKGVAMYDTARAVRRLKGNASDAFLEIVEPRTSARYYDKSLCARPLPPQERRLRASCAAISVWRNYPLLAEAQSWATACGCTACPPPRERTRWRSKRNARRTERCSKKCGRS